MSRISAALRANYLAIFTGVLLLVVAVYMSFFIGTIAMSTVKNYYALVAASPSTQMKKSKKKSPAVSDDDMVYADEQKEANELASNLHDSDNSRILASINNLKAKYASYNQASSDYAARHIGYQANLMDETIISRGNDDFVPSSDVMSQVKKFEAAASDPKVVPYNPYNLTQPNPQ